MQPFEAEVMIEEKVPTVRFVGGRMTTTMSFTCYTVSFTLVTLSDFMKELGVNPLPVESVIEAVEREWALPFCQKEKETLMSKADETFVLPIFRHNETRQISALGVVLEIYTSSPPRAQLCGLWGACDEHSAAFWKGQLSDLTIVVPASTDFTSLLTLFYKIVSELTIFRIAFYKPDKPLYLPRWRCDYIGESFDLHFPAHHAVAYDEALRFVKYVQAEGGVEGVVRGVVAELAVNGYPTSLFECDVPYKVVTVDGLLGKPVLQM